MITDIFIPRFYMLKCLSTSYFYYKWFLIEIKGISSLNASSVIIQRRCTSLVFFYLQKIAIFNSHCDFFREYKPFCIIHFVLIFLFTKRSVFIIQSFIQRKQTHVHILVRLHTPKQIGFLIFFFFLHFTHNSK